MATRFLCKALLTAVLGIVPNPLLAATTTTNSASSNTAGALQLDPPAAPSNCKSTYYRGGPRPDDDYTIVSWTDNSSNEDGFTLELWWRNQSGVWVLSWSENLAANYTAEAFGGRIPSGYRLRVRAFNASGNSAWSNWAH